jgi:PAS domain-containing protein
MPRSTSLGRLLALTWATAAVLTLTVTVITLVLIEDGRNEALRNADKQISRLVAAAETDINRNLMSVDLILAGLQDALRPAVIPGGFDVEAAHQVLAALQDRQLMFADLTLVDESGGTLTSALAATRRTPVGAPPNLLALARSPDARVMQVSPPIIGRASGERSLLLARALDLPGAPPLIALAEVPSSLLLSIASSREVTSGAVLTLERDDGVVLVSQPPDDHLTGRRLAQPLSAALSGGEARGVAGRFDGRPVRQASRPTLYAHLLIAATLPESDALEVWAAQRGRIFTVAAAFIALILGITGIAHRQITGLARARQQASEAAALLDQALASMGDAFLLCDAEDKVVRWNDRYLELFPWLKPVIRAHIPFRALAEAAGRHELAPGADPGQVQAWVDSRMAARRQITDEFVQPLNGGTMVSTVERRTPDGGVVSVYRDMSQKEAQLSRAMRAAEAASEAKSQFLANMSHEIRTPLNAVLGLNGLLLKSSLDTEQRRHAELVQSSGQLLLSLINDILDLTRIDAGRIELQPIRFDPPRRGHRGGVLAAVARTGAGPRAALQYRPRRACDIDGRRRARASSAAQSCRQRLEVHGSGQCRAQGPVRFHRRRPSPRHRGGGHGHRHCDRGAAPALRPLHAGRRHCGPASWRQWPGPGDHTRNRRTDGWQHQCAKHTRPGKLFHRHHALRAS